PRGAPARTLPVHQRPAAHRHYPGAGRIRAARADAGRRRSALYERRRVKTMRMLPSFVDISPDVADALERRRPVVALESAVISHGLPHPTSLQTAAMMEAEVRTAGAVPATVAGGGCADAKAIGDIGKTLEYLDTAGAPVVVYRADRFPNFSARDSGFSAPRQIDTPQAAAAILAAGRALGRRTALLIANPIPAPEALREADVADAVRRAMQLASGAGVRGGDLTPFLLTALADLTGGRSLRANLAL